MSLEVPTNQTEEIAYQDKLEETLGVSEIVSQLGSLFDLFLEEYKEEKGIGLKEKENAEDPELRLLRLIKLFLYKKKNEIQNVTKNSLLSNSDCLTLAIVACLLANKKGYQVKIGRPDKLSRYFHALVVKQNGEMFKVAGRNRNYGVKVMEVKDVINRLRNFKPVFDIAGSVSDLF